MTTITIPIDVAEAAAEALGNFVSDHGWTDSDMRAMDNLDAYIARHKANQAARDKLAKPVDLSAEMSAVADQFAHRLALDLERVLADYSGTWYDAAISTLGAYRKAMSAIHERESPTFMGEPLSSEKLANREETSGSPIEDYSDCHGPDWTERDGEYLK